MEGLHLKKMAIHEINNEAEDKWFIAYNMDGETIIIAVYSKVSAGEYMSVDRDYFEEFDSEAEWLARLIELGLI